MTTTELMAEMQQMAMLPKIVGFYRADTKDVVIATTNGLVVVAIEHEPIIFEEPQPYSPDNRPLRLT